MLKKIIIALSVFAVLSCAAFGYLAVRWKQELTERFAAPKDSVPTKVFSQAFAIKKNMPLSLSELRKRLELRNYEELPQADTAPLVEKSFRVSGASTDLPAPENEEANAVEVQLYLADFEYPVYFRDYIFTGGNMASHNARRFSVLLNEGQVVQIVHEDGAPVEVESVSLEPILVARLNNSSETRRYVKIDEIPHTLLKAIISVEDRRFFDHIGVDFRGILRSVYANLKAGGYVQGASTITQQLVRNIYLTRAKTIRRKFKEIVMAILMELSFDKDVILEKYLNEVYFGQLGSLEIHGVYEAAKHYFGKSLNELSIAEQALLAGIVRGPYYYSPYRAFERTKKRQEFVLDKMLEMGTITRRDYDLAKIEELQFVKTVPVLDRVPYFTEYIKSQINEVMPDGDLLGAGYKIFSTLDLYYQQLAEEKVHNGVVLLEKEFMKRARRKRLDVSVDKVLQSVLLTVDHRTGEIKAIVGGRSYQETTYNRALYMKRQVGSVFKPFVYLTALLDGKDSAGYSLNAASRIVDEPFSYKYDGQVWSPKNYKREYMGEVTLRYALANSINVVAAKLATSIGMERVIETAAAAGITDTIEPLPSMALGAMELSPFDLAKSYTTLANFGLKKELTSILLILDEDNESIARFVNREEQVLPQAETANLVHMMRSAFEEGTAVSAKRHGFTQTAYGKTGTTNDYRDSWFVGFTRDLLTVTWVGFDRDDEDIRKLRNLLRLSGATGALPIWARYMADIYKNSKDLPLNWPEGVLEPRFVDITAQPGVEPECAPDNIIEEVFTPQNAPEFTCNHSAFRLKFNQK